MNIKHNNQTKSISEVISPFSPQPSAKFYPLYFWTIEEPKGRQEYNLSR